MDSFPGAIDHTRRGPPSYKVVTTPANPMKNHGCKPGITRDKSRKTVGPGGPILYVEYLGMRSQFHLHNFVIGSAIVGAPRTQTYRPLVPQLVGAARSSGYGDVSLFFGYIVCFGGGLKRK